MAACQKQESDPPKGTEVENEVVGQLFAQDGSYAAGAKIRIFPVSYSPSRALPKAGAAAPYYSTVTDAKGRYFVDSLERGEYNILAEKDGSLAYQDSVGIHPGPGDLPPDTLKAPATLGGVVALQPNHDPSTAIVELLGTNVFVNVGRDGRFTLPALGEGRYTARVSTTLPDYTPLYTSFAVAAGTTDTLSDTLRIRYTGIPVVTGLRQTGYDTARSIVSLAWSRADFPNLLGYAIYRDAAESATLSTMPINSGRIQDTTYADTLRSASGDSARDLEYRVRIQDRESHYGQAFYFAKVHAPPPSLVRTVLSVQVQNGSTTASIGDTFRIAAAYRNPTRAVGKLFWRLLGSQENLRTRVVEENQGADTLPIALSVPGSYTLLVGTMDAKGDTASSQIKLQVLQDAPSLDLGPDSVATIGDTIRLAAIGSDRYGKITQWHWLAGPDGRYGKSDSAGPWTLALPDSVMDLTITASVTDDDGNTTTDARKLTLSRSRSLQLPPHFPTLPYVFHSSYFVPLDGKLYLLDQGTKTMAAYDPKTGNWTTRASRRASRTEFGVGVHAGKLFLAGGSNRDTTVEAYDPRTDTWTTKGSLLYGRGLPKLIEYKGRLAVAAGPFGPSDGEGIDQIYNDSTNRWEEGNLSDRETSASIYTVDGQMFGVWKDNGGLAYAPINDALAKTAPLAYTSITCKGGVSSESEFNGIVYAVGAGPCSSSEPGNVFALDLRTKGETLLPPTLPQNQSLYKPNSAVLDGVLYLVGYVSSIGEVTSFEGYRLP